MVATLSVGSGLWDTGFASFLWIISRSEAISNGFTRTSSACKADGGQRLVQLWEPAEHQRYCIRVGVPHGADDGETIPRMRHVQVGEEYVKLLCRDAAERLAYAGYGDYLEPI